MTPVVALIGRPNSGKSALFNRLIGKRKAIVSPVSGTTRDVLREDISLGRKKAVLMDLAGLSVSETSVRPGVGKKGEARMREERASLPRIIQEHAQAALNEADVVLFCVDASVPLTSEDMRITQMLRKAKKPVIVAATKADNDKVIAQAHEVYGLGLGEIYFVSSEHNLGITELKEALKKAVGKTSLSHRVIESSEGKAVGSKGQVVRDKEQEGRRKKMEDDGTDNHQSSIINHQSPISFSLVGKPNVGKSSLFNALLGEQKSIVSDVPGTTRDVVDTVVERDGRKFLVVDTAGLRRPGKRERGIEFYSVRRCMDAITRSDVCLLVLDGMETVSKMDQAVSRAILEEEKGLIIVVNKWDAAKQSAGSNQQAAKTKSKKQKDGIAPLAPSSGQRTSVRGKGKYQHERDHAEAHKEGMPSEALAKGGRGDFTKYQSPESFPGEAMMHRYLDYLQEKFDYISWAPVLFMSAATGENVEEIWKQVELVWSERQKRIGTGQLNAFLQKTVLTQHPTGTKGVFPKIYYGTQVETNPPHFIIFVNQPDAFHFSWRRYLEKQLREKFGFTGTPVEIEYRERKRGSHP